MTEQRQLALAERVVQRAAEYEDKLAKVGKHASQDILAQIRSLSKEYFILRITLVGSGKLLRRIPSSMDYRHGDKSV